MDESYDEQQVNNDHTDKDDFASGPPDHQDADATASSWMEELMAETFTSSVKKAMDESFLPRAHAIQDEVRALQYECSSVTERATAEKLEPNDELARLANLISSFQQSLLPLLTLTQMPPTPANLSGDNARRLTFDTSQQE